MVWKISERRLGTLARWSRVKETRPMLIKISRVVETTSLCGSDLLHLAIRDASWVTGEPEGKTSVILTQHSRDSLVDRSRVLTARMSWATSRMEKI